MFTWIGCFTWGTFTSLSPVLANLTATTNLTRLLAPSMSTDLTPITRWDVAIPLNHPMLANQAVLAGKTFGMSTISFIPVMNTSRVDSKSLGSSRLCCPGFYWYGPVSWCLAPFYLLLNTFRGLAFGPDLAMKTDIIVWCAYTFRMFAISPVLTMNTPWNA